MVYDCIVPGCKNYSGSKPDLHFHAFPFSDELRLEQWVGAIARENWTAKKTSRVCSDHFTENDYIAPLFSKLKSNAVPSLILPVVCVPDEEIENMVHCCAALDCRETTDIRTPGITFHSFPPEPERLKQWVEAMNRPNYTPSKNAKVCSKHFEKSCYVGNRNRLRNDALPTLFQFKDKINVIKDANMENIDSEPAVASTSTPGFSEDVLMPQAWPNAMERKDIISNTSEAVNSNQLPKLVVSPFYTNLTANTLQNMFPTSSGIPVTLTQNVFDPLLIQSAVQPSEDVPCITVVSVEKIISAAASDPPATTSVSSAATSLPSATANPLTEKPETADTDEETQEVSDTESIPLDRRRERQIIVSKAMMKHFKVKLGNYRKKIKGMQQKERRLVKMVAKLLIVLDGLKSNKKSVTDEMLGSATHFLLES